MSEEKKSTAGRKPGVLNLTEADFDDVPMETPVEEKPKKRGVGRPKGSVGMKGTKQGAFTPPVKRKFLKHLVKTGGNIKAAAGIVGVSPATISYHQRIDPVFKEKVLLAKYAAMGNVEAAISERGIEGVEKDVYYQGAVVGKERVYSDNLLLARAKALDSERYGNNSKVDIKAEVSVETKARSKLASLLGVEIAEGEYETEEGQ